MQALNSLKRTPKQWWKHSVTSRGAQNVTGNTTRKYATGTRASFVIPASGYLPLSTGDPVDIIFVYISSFFLLSDA